MKLFSTVGYFMLHGVVSLFIVVGAMYAAVLLLQFDEFTQWVWILSSIIPNAFVLWVLRFDTITPIAEKYRKLSRQLAYQFPLLFAFLQDHTTFWRDIGLFAITLFIGFSVGLVSVLQYRNESTLFGIASLVTILFFSIMLSVSNGTLEVVHDDE